MPAIRSASAAATPAPVHHQIQPGGDETVVNHERERATFAAAPKGQLTANFRWGGKLYFLTYSQVGDAPNEAVTNFFNGLGARVEHWGAVEEHHGDGGRHWHVFVKFGGNGYRGRGAAALDIAGIHPNIQVAKGDPANLNRIWKYMHKEEGSTFWGTWEFTPFDLSAEKMTTAKNAWYSVLRDAKDQDHAWALIDHHAVGTSKDLFMNYDKIRSFVEHRWPREAVVFKPKFTDFPNLPRALRDWWDIEAQKPDRPKSLVLISESRLGKTAWARSLGRHTYMCGMWNSDNLDRECEYVVLDDMDPEWFKGYYKSFLGAQQEFNVTDKYRGKTRISDWSKPCIWLCNPEMDPRNAKGFSRDWLDKNCVFYELKWPLFGERQPEWDLREGRLAIRQRSPSPEGPTTPFNWSPSPTPAARRPGPEDAEGSGVRGGTQRADDGTRGGGGGGVVYLEDLLAPNNTRGF
ncbi:hypothetical protein QCA50_021154 [Cerrena zonata]|uniref:CRESS-DNA virus Rep endonuclease domain-containing protein n=1 Tax=Cerrena zonata TaxID=2478898 RepID=A0AAW0F826_9APHY